MSEHALLGHEVPYVETYTPSLLDSIPRAVARAEAGIQALPFAGEDLWHAYELSWLNERGRPVVAALRMRVPCSSGAIVESKSLKLYLGSFAQTRFAARGEVQRTLDSDLSLAFRAPVIVELLEPKHLPPVSGLPGRCLDDVEGSLDTYERDPDLLCVVDRTMMVDESLHTHLFRSVCPVTGQPDLATVMVQYRGAPIDRGALLAYLVSHRTTAAFHEAAVEQIFMDIDTRCTPLALSVTGWFTRRGGIDINPHRTNRDDLHPVARVARQ
jgi:7-cyano-7-deazaguanine reductase